MEAARKRSEMVDAVYKTGTVIGLGGLLYFGWWLYDFSTNMQIKISNDINATMGDVVPVDFPINPWLASKNALASVWILSGGKGDPPDSDLQNNYLEMLRNITVMGLPVGAWGEDIAGNIVNTPATEYAKFKQLQSRVSESGTFRGYTWEYQFMKNEEGKLVASGLIPAEDVQEKHPVDQIAEFVVHNKWYWGGVLGLASIPAITLGAETLKDMGIKHVERLED